MHRIIILVTVLCSATAVWGQALSAQPEHPQTKKFISLKLLDKVNQLAGDSVNRIIQCAPPTTLSLSSLHEQADIAYRAFKKDNRTSNVLTPQAYNGRYVNSFVSVLVASQVNDAFVSSVNNNASRIRDVVNDIANNTATPGDTHTWVGGQVDVFLIGNARVHTATTSCSLLIIFNKALEVVAVPRWMYLRGADPFSSNLLIMGPEHAPTSCTGSGVVFIDHGQTNQRLWLSATTGSNGKRATSPGVVNDTLLNRGNSAIPLPEETLKRMDRLKDGDLGAPPGGDLTRAFASVEAEFARGLEQYNNVGFVILSVAAMLSSTAIASVSLGADWERIAVVAVEATVVYSFLAIVTHACVVFLRAESFLVDIRSTGVGNFTTEDGLIVHMFHQKVTTGVGSRTTTPVLLVVTEVFAAISAAIVTLTVIASFRHLGKRWREQKDIDAEECKRLEEEVYEEGFAEKSQ